MEIISRQEAMLRGFPRFFTGIPCIHGHVAERYVSDNQGRACVVCRATSNALRRSRLRAKDPDKFRSAQRGRLLKHLYGMTYAEEQVLLEEQGGVCACCGMPPKTKPLCVDHDHANGKVRGLLCNRCNTSIAALESPMKPIWEDYLASHRTAQGDVVQEHTGWEAAYV